MKLVDKSVLLQKFPGKGGWTFAAIPEIPMDNKNPFGWVRVRGSVDGVTFSAYHLMPMGNGNLFLPVKSEIRKKIRKEAGDTVHIILYLDQLPLEIPPEFLACLNDEPKAFNFFNTLTDSEKKLYLEWIYAAKKEETKVNRMAKAINCLSQQQKFRQSDTNT